MSLSFHVRPASTSANDGLRILQFGDSQIPWLKDVGSAAQWGESLLSADEGMLEYYQDKVALSEASADKGFGKDWCRAFILEVDVSSESLSADVRQLASTAVTPSRTVRVPVAAMILQGVSEDYVQVVLPEQDRDDPFLFLKWLVTDRRTGSLSRRAGERLMDYMKDEARRLGLRRICADCWRGNERRLVKYYECYGFTAIGDFGSTDAEAWPGTVLEMRL